jgi:hypothetical protein
MKNLHSMCPKLSHAFITTTTTTTTTNTVGVVVVVITKWYMIGHHARATGICPTVAVVCTRYQGWHPTEMIAASPDRSSWYPNKTHKQTHISYPPTRAVVPFSKFV